MKKKLIIDYTITQVLFFSMVSVMYDYGAYLLITIGYSSSKAGFLLSVGCIISLLLQAIVANISDNSKKLSIFKISAIVSAFSLLANIYGYLRNDVSLLTSIGFVLMFGIYSALEPMNNAIPDTIKRHGYDITFGFGRAFGSISYALTSLIVGFLTEKYSYQVITILNMITSVLMICSYLVTEKHYKTLTEVQEQTKEKQETISFFSFFKRHFDYVLLSLAICGIYFGFTMSENLAVLIIENVNGTTKDIGFVMSLKAILEVPVIFFYDKLENKFGTTSLLIFAAVNFTVKALVTYLATSTTLLILAQLIQPISFAIMIPAIVSYTNKVMSAKEAVRGQAMFPMFTAIASILSSSVGGAIAESYSVSAMLLVALIVSAVSSVAFIALLKKK